MALQTVDSPIAPSSQVVANAFVEQYYHILHHSPELVYRFYQDSSVLSRQEENGVMTSVTTMQGINAKILSLDYKNCKAEIKTADAQESYKDGVIVLVTGCLTGKDSLRKKFAQSFFLAPQAKGYFVLNDVFRYVGESEPLDANVMTVEKVDGSGAIQSAADTETICAPNAPVREMTTSDDNDANNVEKSFATSEEMQVGTEGEEVLEVPQSTENHIPESSKKSSQEDGVKNSYASIVKKINGSPGSAKVYVPTNTVRLAPSNTQKQSSASVSPASIAEVSVQTNRKTPECVNTHEEGTITGYYIVEMLRDPKGKRNPKRKATTDMELGNMCWLEADQEGEVNSYVDPVTKRCIKPKKRKVFQGKIAGETSGHPTPSLSTTQAGNSAI